MYGPVRYELHFPDNMILVKVMCLFSTVLFALECNYVELFSRSGDGRDIKDGGDMGFVQIKNSI